MITLLLTVIFLLTTLTSVSSARIIYHKDFGKLIKDRRLTIRKSNIIDVPLICPPGYLIDHTRRCRKAWTWFHHSLRMESKSGCVTVSCIDDKTKNRLKMRHLICKYLFWRWMNGKAWLDINWLVLCEWKLKLSVEKNIYLKILWLSKRKLKIE